MILRTLSRLFADSFGNRYVYAEVAGGGYAYWPPREWWQGAHVTVALHKGRRGPAAILLDFHFPEGRLVDPLAHGIANVLDVRIRLRVQWRRWIRQRRR